MPEPTVPDWRTAAEPDDIPPWHTYDGCHGCRRGNAIAKRVVTMEAPDAG